MSNNEQHGVQIKLKGSVACAQGKTVQKCMFKIGEKPILKNCTSMEAFETNWLKSGIWTGGGSPFGHLIMGIFHFQVLKKLMIYNSNLQSIILQGPLATLTVSKG